MRTALATLLLSSLASSGVPAVATTAYAGAAEARRVAASPSVGHGTAAGAAMARVRVTAPVQAAPQGEFGWPLAGTPAVVRPFDPPEHPYGPGHRGVDLGGQDGQLVLAAGAGVVAFAGMVAGRPVISVDHPGGLRTTYEPAAATVATGEPVGRGQPIGMLQAGHDGCPVTACLHWGVRRGQEYLDPLWLLFPGHVRLLPGGA